MEGASVRRGGNKGVVAKARSLSMLSRTLGLSMSIATAL